MNAMTQNHPECGDEELYLGNFNVEDAKTIGWKSKRAGIQAYRSDGTPYPFQKEHGVKPYFANKKEVEDGIRKNPLYKGDFKFTDYINSLGETT